MKKLLFFLLLFVNLQCVIQEDGSIQFSAFTTVQAQHYTREVQYITEPKFRCNDCCKMFFTQGELDYHQKHNCYSLNVSMVALLNLRQRKNAKSIMKQIAHL